jgi:hypothetical protein
MIANSEYEGTCKNVAVTDFKLQMYVIQEM